MRALWGCTGAAVGLFVGMMLAVAVVIGVSSFDIHVPFNHGLFLMVLILLPIIVGGCYGIVWPIKAKTFASQTFVRFERLFPDRRI